MAKGIQETKEVLAFALTFGSSLGKALKDGKINLADLPSFVLPLTKLPLALGGINEVPAEIKDLSEEEKKELLAYVADNFDIENANVEAAVVDGLALVLALHSYVTKYFVKA